MVPESAPLPLVGENHWHRAVKEPPCLWLVHGMFYANCDAVFVDPQLDHGAFWGGHDCVAHECFPKDRGGVLW